ncbi:MAG: DMT family transporter [Neisseriaceae bacterium]|nr:DMT family transporter [Neisseriaceae bacterium]MBP6860889.1 DMT family transporter [Neisseriaceae bacterium]
MSTTSTPTHQRPLNGTAAMIKMAISMIIFGSVGFFSVQTGLPAIELVFIRCVAATLFLGGLWFATGQYKKEKRHTRELVHILICGVFLILNWVFLFKSFETLSITIAISIYHLAPVMVLIFGSLLFKERLNLMAVLAIAVCFVGTLFIAGINQNTSLKDFMASGLLWGLLAAFFYACTTLMGKGIKYTSTYAVTSLQTLVGVLMLLPFVNLGAFEGLSSSNWVYIAATGLIHTGLVFYLFFDSIRLLSAKVISILVFLDPAVAIVMDVLLLDFVPTHMQTIGVALIFIGMAFTLKPTTKKTT